MPRDNSYARRKQRRREADERLAANIVINCQCGNRHFVGWTGCADPKEIVQ